MGWNKSCAKWREIWISTKHQHSITSINHLHLGDCVDPKEDMGWYYKFNPPEKSLSFLLSWTLKILNNKVDLTVLKKSFWFYIKKWRLVHLVWHVGFFFLFPLIERNLIDSKEKWNTMKVKDSFQTVSNLRCKWLVGNCSFWLRCLFRSSHHNKVTF